MTYERFEDLPEWKATASLTQYFSSISEKAENDAFLQQVDHLARQS